MAQPAATAELDAHSLITLLTKVCFSLLHYANLQHGTLLTFLYITVN